MTGGEKGKEELRNIFSVVVRDSGPRLEGSTPNTSP